MLTSGRVFATLLGAAMLLAATDARAEGAHRHHFLAKVVGLGHLHHGATTGEGGASLGYEYELIPHWLELEVTAGFLSSAHGTFMPLELMVKKPFELSHAVHPFFGLGPEVLVDPTHSSAYVGLDATFGTYVWLTEHLGLLMAVDYALIVHDGANHEFKGAFGLSWRV